MRGRKKWPIPVFGLSSLQIRYTLAYSPKSRTQAFVLRLLADPGRSPRPLSRRLESPGSDRPDPPDGGKHPRRPRKPREPLAAPFALVEWGLPRPIGTAYLITDLRVATAAEMTEALPEIPSR
jgi:hypothetical protein